MHSVYTKAYGEINSIHAFGLNDKEEPSLFLAVNQEKEMFLGLHRQPVNNLTRLWVVPIPDQPLLNRLVSRRKDLRSFLKEAETILEVLISNDRTESEKLLEGTRLNLPSEGLFVVEANTLPSEQDTTLAYFEWIWSSKGDGNLSTEQVWLAGRESLEEGNATANVVNMVFNGYPRAEDFASKEEAVQMLKRIWDVVDNNDGTKINVEWADKGIPKEWWDSYNV